MTITQWGTRIVTGKSAVQEPAIIPTFARCPKDSGLIHGLFTIPLPERDSQLLENHGFSPAEPGLHQWLQSSAPPGAIFVSGYVIRALQDCSPVLAA